MMLPPPKRRRNTAEKRSMCWVKAKRSRWKKWRISIIVHCVYRSSCHAFRIYILLGGNKNISRARHFYYERNQSKFLKEPSWKMKRFRMSASTRIAMSLMQKNDQRSFCIYGVAYAIFFVFFFLFKISYLYSLIALISMQFGFLLHRLHLNVYAINYSIIHHHLSKQPKKWISPPFIILDWSSSIEPIKKKLHAAKDSAIFVRL